ncbi:MAG: hypothetical protein V1872_10420 [bacterium]
MKKKNHDTFYLAFVLATGSSLVFYYVFHFFQSSHGKSLVGKSLCVIIALVFIWGIVDILCNYISLVKEDDQFAKFRDEFAPEKKEDLQQQFANSIIGNRFITILRLKDSLSEISHEILTDILSAKENTRAVFAKYFLGACVMLGLLGTFLGLLETVSGAYIAIELLDKSDQLIKSLHQPLGGISLAFGTSIVGIIASLTLGFTYVFLYRRQILFLSELEEYTQTVLIPTITKSSGKMLDEIVSELRAIKGSNLFQKLFLGIEDSINRHVELISTLLQSNTERNIDRINKFFEEATKVQQDASKTFINQWTGFFEKEIAKNRTTIEDNLKDFNQKSLEKSERLYQQNIGLFSQTSQEIKTLNLNLYEAQTMSLKALEQTVSTLSKSTQEFNETMQDEQKSCEVVLTKFTEVGEMLEEMGALVQSNQIQMQAASNMFVHGVDKILEYFYQQKEKEKGEKDFLEKLETSLNLFHERAGSVLLEYTARSREVFSGLIENQINLNREFGKIKKTKEI